MPYGQKIYVYEHGTEKQLCEPVYGYIVPRPGELYTFFDVDTGVYTHCEVIQVTHGSNTDSCKMVSTIHVKVINTEKQ